MCPLLSSPTIRFLGLVFGSLVFAASCADKSSSPPAGLWGGKAEGNQAPGPSCETDPSACAPLATGPNLLRNSDFNDDLVGWVIELTGPNASVGELLPAVVDYDVRGEGQTSPSAGLQVGQKQYVAGTVNPEGVYVPGPAEGAILFQEVTVDEQGLLELTVDIATHMPAGGKWKSNNFGGAFELMVDRHALVSFDFGGIDAEAPQRRTLTARVQVSAGPHEIGLGIRRPMRNVGSPTQYIDNFTAALVVEGPPEPPAEESPVEQPAEETVEGPPEPPAEELPVEGPPEPPEEQPPVEGPPEPPVEGPQPEEV